MAEHQREQFSNEYETLRKRMYLTYGDSLDPAIVKDSSPDEVQIRSRFDMLCMMFRKSNEFTSIPESSRGWHAIRGTSSAKAMHPDSLVPNGQDMTWLYENSKSMFARAFIRLEDLEQSAGAIDAVSAYVAETINDPDIAEAELSMLDNLMSKKSQYLDVQQAADFLGDDPRAAELRQRAQGLAVCMRRGMLPKARSLAPGFSKDRYLPQQTEVAETKPKDPHFGIKQ